VKEGRHIRMKDFPQLLSHTNKTWLTREKYRY